MKKYQITEHPNHQFNQHLIHKTKNTMWITDAVLLPEINRLCVSTSKRDLRFFNISSENFSEDFSIGNIPANPTCLEYFYDVKSFLY